MTAVVLAWTELRRAARDRTFLFFALFLPFMVILLIGVTTSGFAQERVAVVQGDRSTMANALVTELDAAPGLQVVRVADRGAGVQRLRSGEVTAVVLVPADFATTLQAGRSVVLPVLTTGAVGSGGSTLTTIRSVVARQAATVQAAAFATERVGGTFAQNQARALALQRQAPVTGVSTVVVDSASNYLPLGFSYSAPTMLVLFVFINATAGGAAIIQTRRFGIFSRALAAPVRPRDLVLGEGLCYLALAAAQAALIVVVGAVVFGVGWGNPLAATLLIGVWCLVGTGAGLVSGTLFHTPEQASAIGPAVGIAFGMLGGCMWPLEIVPAGVRAAGHLTPHAWAVDAWVTLLSRGGGVGDILGPLAVLSGFAVLLLGTATFRLRRSLVTG
ncbi:ABC transporter permease [Phycicoccus sp. 3266]|uniref:ABC transporter permease n=1 Tax=Phycicoccus sp. 3266 TaxID=2817751 RepID=UPI00285C763B|nr:ABC transporter permease [Phycicoccus sp. 3266]MDR6861730.1 ABC-2 type transport system permease protein [Phycicoccus sp. 3266]